MKKLFVQIVLLSLMLIAWVSCHKDKEIDVKEATISNEEVTVSASQVLISWQVDFVGKFQTGVEVCQSEDMTDAILVEASEKEGRFVTIVEGLSEGTKYYYRIVVWNKFSSFEYSGGDFTTTKIFSVRVSAEPSNGGTLTGGGNYNEGDTCTVVASANGGYNFVNWTENGNQVSANLEYSFAVNGSRSLVAHFTSQEYTIIATASPEIGGMVSGSGGYSYGDQCTLTATPNEGYSFVKWTKDDGSYATSNSVYAFTVTETATYVAYFQKKSYTVFVEANPENGGAVDGGGTYEFGQSCTVHATETNGYHFVNWTENGEQVCANAIYTFAVTRDYELVANFTLQDCIISVEIDPEEGGTVNGSGGYSHGERCTLTATSNEGYSFVKWTKDDGSFVTSDSTYVFTVTETETYVAHFRAINYTISVLSEPSAGGVVSGGGDGFHYGDQCTLTAIANSGFVFTNWTENGNVVSTDSIYSFTVTRDRALVANFLQGVVNGLFSIGFNKKVWFSQGNLQYNAAQGSHQCADGTTQQGTWRFAENQWDYIGQANSNISQDYNGWIDLFGWGTSGWSSGISCYHPWDYVDNEYMYGPEGPFNLTGEYANSDWGIYNAISNGGNQSGQWRSLLFEEWSYVLYTRNTPSDCRFVKAQLNGVNGLILFPDNWDSNNWNSCQNINDGASSFDDNVLDNSIWPFLENLGLVFLPVAGCRVGVSVEGLPTEGYYWTATHFIIETTLPVGACDVDFNNTSLLQYGFSYRYAGFSVRLARDYQ
jgi:hypothetical protein